MDEFVTSDLHLRHENIRVYCPGRSDRWNTTEEMTQGLIDNWNRVVGFTDTVHVFGDLAMGKILDTLTLLPQLNGNIELWCGNHDRPWLGHPEKKRRGWAEKYEAASPGHITVHPEHFGTLHGIQFSHFPFSGDSQDSDRYVEHRPVDHGQWLLHGHVHDAWKVKGRQINVGVDVWDYEPVPFDTLRQLMSDIDYLRRG